MTVPFNHSQLKFFRKFAEALLDGFAMAIPLAQVVANFERQFELIGGEPVKRMGKVLTLLPLGLDPLFNGLPLATRKRLINDKLRHGRTRLGRDAARLRAVVYGAYYGHWQPGGQDGNHDNPVHREIGFTLPKFRDRSSPAEMKIEQVMGREIDSGHVLLPGDVEDEYDVIVVGSGSGGGIAARNLAVGHGYAKVLVIEAGPFMPSPAITHEEREMGARLFKDGTLQSTKDDDIVIFQGRNVGGSPTINNGICLRMSQDPLGNPHARNPFDAWKGTYGLDLEAAFQSAYDQVAGHLGIGVAEQRSGRGNGNHLLDGWSTFRAGRAEPWVQDATPGWFTKNYGPPNTPQACAYCGYCNTGCRYARKLAPAQTYLKEACDHGARILADSEVERIVWEDEGKKPWRAVGVLVEVGPSRTPRTIRARAGVVVAAGTIASSLLLKASRIERTGKGISLNVASPMIALMHDDTATPAETANFPPAWNEDQMTTAVDCGGFLLESHFQPPQSMAMLMPGWFGELQRRMQAYGRIRSAGVLVPVDRAGKLDDGRLKLKFAAAEMEVLRLALATLAKVHFANGAKEVWPALRTGEALVGPQSEAQIDAFFKRTVVNQDDLTLSSAHPHGGNPMHPDPKKGVVDPACRLHGASNVLVTDASVFPGSIRVNAHFSTMALAQHATGGADPFG